MAHNKLYEVRRAFRDALDSTSLFFEGWWRRPAYFVDEGRYAESILRSRTNGICCPTGRKREGFAQILGLV